MAGIFTLLYLVSQAVLYAAEAAVVWRRRLWPRAVVTSRPTAADIQALTTVALVQEKLPSERITVSFSARNPTPGFPPVTSGLTRRELSGVGPDGDRSGG